MAGKKVWFQITWVDIYRKEAEINRNRLLEAWELAEQFNFMHSD